MIKTVDLQKMTNDDYFGTNGRSSEQEPQQPRRGQPPLHRGGSSDDSSSSHRIAISEPAPPAVQHAMHSCWLALVGVATTPPASEPCVGLARSMHGVLVRGNKKFGQIGRPRGGVDDACALALHRAHNADCQAASSERKLLLAACQCSRAAQCSFLIILSAPPANQ